MGGTEGDEQTEHKAMSCYDDFESNMSGPSQRTRLIKKTDQL